MSEGTRNRITERQAEARRQNGKQARGAVTDEGKRRSSQNATKHGIWARPLQHLGSGPLRENAEQYEAFLDGVIQDLNPGEHFVLRQMALDVADKAWRLSRAQRWEVDGYSNPGSAGEHSTEATLTRVLATHDRTGAAVVRRLPDPSIPVDDLWKAMAPLSYHFGASEKSLYAMKDDEVADALTELIELHFDSPEEAAQLLESWAEEKEEKVDGFYAADRPGVVRGELDSSFSRNAERLVTHTSRELDRSLKRYWELWERLQMSQPRPNVVPETTEDENPSASEHVDPIPADRSSRDEDPTVPEPVQTEADGFAWLLEILEQQLAQGRDDK